MATPSTGSTAAFVEAALTFSPIDEHFYDDVACVFRTLILGNHNADYHASGMIKDCRCSGFSTYGCPYFTSGGQLCGKFYCDYQLIQKVKNFEKLSGEIKEMELDKEQVELIANRLGISSYSLRKDGEKTEKPHLYFF